MVANEHRSIGLEHDQIPAAVQPAINPEIIEADALLDCAQRFIMRDVEKSLGVG